MDKILWWVFYFFTLYAFLPGFISRIFGFRVFMRGFTEREIALTFDDGPDPVYTPQLLDLLKEYGAKATFFVVGSNAERHPDIIRRIYEEGHDIGIHNYVHRTNWLMRPKTVKRQVHRTSEIIKGITGSRPAFYRPPWGIVNVFDYSNLGYLHIVLWTSMFKDWKKKVGADGLYRKMRRKLKPGEVFLLHDCGTTFGADREAPANTLAALRRILEDNRKLGYRFVGMEEMMALTERNKKNAKKAAAASVGPIKKAVVAVWMVWERAYHAIFRLRPVGDGFWFHYRVCRYNGPELELDGRERLKPKDWIMELHFNNRMLYRAGMTSRSAMQLAIRLLRTFERSLPLVADELRKLPNAGKIKAVYGITMINKGAEALGFRTFDLKPGLFSWLTNQYLRLLLSIIHPDGKKRMRLGKEKLVPRRVVMSRDALLAWGKGQIDGDKPAHADVPIVPAALTGLGEESFGKSL
jgi:peptidoglycan/xylan/chitin deacetylase (PgdA/CDA1 family)